MTTYEINTRFKGSRTYIQGPDILNQVMHIVHEEHGRNLTNIEFLIHQMTGENLLLQLTNEKNLNPVSGEIATIRLQADGRPLQGRIKRGHGLPTERVPYDETLVTSQCTIDQPRRIITLESNNSGFSPIEVLVSMNKALHLAVLNKAQDASWVFCRWESPEWPLPTELNGLSISVEQALGTRLTRSVAKLAGQTIGSIFFSAKTAS